MTGLPIIDTIGSTEMLHTFIANPPDALRPGATGKPLPGYQAIVVDEDFHPVPAGEVGRLAVRGLSAAGISTIRGRALYVQHGWNVTGDAFLVDEDGYFWYRGRTDDMIVSAGYNISGIEIETVLLEHAAVRECAVVASPDDRRGMIPKAFVVPREPVRPGSDLVGELQEFVKKQIAPYKYPRRVEFLEPYPAPKPVKFSDLSSGSWKSGGLRRKKPKDNFRLSSLRVSGLGNFPSRMVGLVCMLSDAGSVWMRCHRTLHMIVTSPLRTYAHRRRRGRSPHQSEDPVKAGRFACR